MSKTMLGHSRHGTRSMHTKSFGLLCSSLEVFRKLPAMPAQVLFEVPGPTMDRLMFYGARWRSSMTESPCPARSRSRPLASTAGGCTAMS